MPFLNPVNTEVLCAHTHPSTLHTALFSLVLKSTKQVANIQTSCYVVVGTDMLLQKLNKKTCRKKLQKNTTKKENRLVLKISRFSFRHFGLVFEFKIELAASLIFYIGVVPQQW